MLPEGAQCGCVRVSLKVWVQFAWDMTPHTQSVLAGVLF